MNDIINKLVKERLDFDRQQYDLVKTLPITDIEKIELLTTVDIKVNECKKISAIIALKEEYLTKFYKEIIKKAGKNFIVVRYGRETIISSFDEFKLQIFDTYDENEGALESVGSMPIRFIRLIEYLKDKSTTKVIRIFVKKLGAQELVLPTQTIINDIIEHVFTYCTIKKFHYYYG